MAKGDFLRRFAEEQAAEEAAKEALKQPLKVIIDDEEFTLRPGYETLYNEDESKSITFYGLLKYFYPDQFTSLRQNIDTPPELSLIGASGQARIMHYVRLHFAKPPPLTAEQLDFLRPFVQRICGSMEEHLVFPAQYQYAKWATNRDEDLALALILYHGWPPKPKKNLELFCFYKLEQLPTGIRIIIDQPHTFQERLRVACSEIRSYCIFEKQKPTFAELMQVAMRRFYFYQGYYTAISNSFSQVIKNKIGSYITAILSDKNPDDPTIEEPSNLLEPQSFTLSWDDFKIGISSAQKKQRETNGYNRSLAACREALNHLPQNVELSRAQLNLHSTTITTYKKHGFISSPRRGVYIIHYPKEDSDE